MEIDEWLKPNENMKDFVKLADDKDKKCEIMGAKLADTKYGTKLFVDVKFDDGTEKTLVLGKSLARKLKDIMGETPQWVGKRGTIVSIMLNVPKIGLKERPMFNPEVVKVEDVKA